MSSGIPPVLDMDDEKGRKTFEFDLSNEVGFQSFAGSDVDKYFLID
jgi:hypothetical protein